MKIEKDKRIMVFRYSQYKSYDFIEEHQKIINIAGATWMLKFGKQIPASVLESLREQKGGLLLKAPKLAGGGYYYCIVQDCFNGVSNSEMSFPEYYKYVLRDGYQNRLEGTWFKISSIMKVKPEIGRHLKLISNNRILDDVIQETRTVVMHTFSENEISI